MDVTQCHTYLWRVTLGSCDISCDTCDIGCDTCDISCDICDIGCDVCDTSCDVCDKRDVDCDRCDTFWDRQKAIGRGRCYTSVSAKLTNSARAFLPLSNLFSGKGRKGQIHPFTFCRFSFKLHSMIFNFSLSLANDSYHKAFDALCKAPTRLRKEIL